MANFLNMYIANKPEAIVLSDKFIIMRLLSMAREHQNPEVTYNSGNDFGYSAANPQGLNSGAYPSGRGGGGIILTHA